MTDGSEAIASCFAVDFECLEFNANTVNGVLRATRDIMPGEVVLDEAPLIVVDPDSFQQQVQECMPALRGVLWTYGTEGMSKAHRLVWYAAAFANAESHVRERGVTMFRCDMVNDMYKKAAALLCETFCVPYETLSLALSVAAFHGHQYKSTCCALFPVACQAPHSCDANMHYKTATGNLVFRAWRHIKCGEILTSNSLDPKQTMKPTVTRRKQIFESFGYWCECSRCLGEDSLRLLPCPAVTCKGTISHCIVREPPWLCGTCNSSFSDEHDIIEREVDLIRRYNSLERILPHSKANASHVAECLDVLISRLGVEHGLWAHFLHATTSHLFKLALEGSDERLTILAFQQDLEYFNWVKTQNLSLLHLVSTDALRSFSELREFLDVFDKQKEELLRAGTHFRFCLQGHTSKASARVISKFRIDLLQLAQDTENALALEWGDSDDDVIAMRSYISAHCMQCGLANNEIDCCN